MQALLLPGAPAGRWSPILLPGSARTLLKPYNQTLWGLSYAAIANASLSLAFMGFERFNGSFRPGKNTAVPHTSILVRPQHPPCPRKAAWCEASRSRARKDGGAAGYCPRVRCVYCTPQFIAIAGKPAVPI